MTTTTERSASSDESDRERFSDILAAQRAAYRRDGAPSLAKRRTDLKKFRAAMVAHRRDIEEAINTDFGNRSRHETAMMELLGVVQGIDYPDRNLRRFMQPTRRHVALHLRMGSNHIEYQPLGVVGVISPWNYPVHLSLMPVVTAIAAGNRAMLKPSKFAPATNAVLTTMISETFPADHVTVVDGDGAAFSSLPFDHLVFTGVERSAARDEGREREPRAGHPRARRQVADDRRARATSHDRAVSPSSSASSSTPGRPASRPTTPWFTESEVDDFVEASTGSSRPRTPTARRTRTTPRSSTTSSTSAWSTSSRTPATTARRSSRSDTGPRTPPSAPHVGAHGRPRRHRRR